MLQVCKVCAHFGLKRDFSRALHYHILRLCLEHQELLIPLLGEISGVSPARRNRVLGATKDRLPFTVIGDAQNLDVSIYGGSPKTLLTSKIVLQHHDLVDLPFSLSAIRDIFSDQCVHTKG